MRLDHLTLAFSLSFAVLATSPVTTVTSLSTSTSTSTATATRSEAATHKKTSWRPTGTLNPAQLQIHREVEECKEIRKLEKLVKDPNNATTMAAQNATAKLSKLRSNTTLLIECAHLQLLRECRELHRLEIDVVVISNATLFVEFQRKHNLTVVEITKFKSDLPKMQSQLSGLQKNSTLVNECKVLKTTGTRTKTKMPMTMVATMPTLQTSSIVTINTAAAGTTIGLNVTSNMSVTALPSAAMVTANAAPGLRAVGLDWRPIVSGLFIAVMGSLAGFLLV